ncbi:LysR family transcriptional regulator [Gammaproteobacteria bacterium AS21]|jgi:DNA-binding transcriptional LysR family regulator
MGFKKVALSGQLADIDIKLLRIFKAVVDAQGVTAAEAELNLANSTISNYLSDLEKRLDMRLCERGRKGFVVTKQGHLVYEASVELLDALHKFRNTINDSHQLLAGELHIICAEHTLGINDFCIVKAIDDFKESAPNVNMTISVMESNTIVGAIADNKADIGITVPLHSYPKLHTIDLFKETMLLYCAGKHPLFTADTHSLNIDELLTYDFVESPRLRAGQETHVDVKKWHMASKAHHQEARMSLILSGHYLGFLPQQLVEQWRLQEQLKPLFIEQYGYENVYQSISSKRSNNQSLINMFNTLLKKNLN